jgi:peptidoglycan/xylan/chitin deacetylase (PgdA/CDA1 family)
VTTGRLGLAAGLPLAVQLAPGVTRSPVVRSFLPRLNGDGDRTHVALTFDDGPDPESTPAFLDCLERLDVRATFFVLGEMVERSPALARELVARGHEVGVHGWDHRSLALRGPASTWRQVRDGARAVEHRTGRAATWWRPPYGVLTASGLVAARRSGLTPVLWGAWGEDWTAHATPDGVSATVARGHRPGVTVLLHDSSCTSAPGSWRAALGALPRIVARCREEGLEVGPLRSHGIPGC